MTSPHHDPEVHERLRALREAAPPERARAAVRDAAARESDVGARSPWPRRLGRPVGLAMVGVLATGTAVAAATGTLGFGGLTRSTSEDDTSAPALRGLVSQLEQQAGGTSAVRSGRVARDGLDIQVALTGAQLCFSAPGQRTTTDGVDARSNRQDGERPMPSFDDVPRADDLRQRPRQVGCVSIDEVGEGPLPAVAGSDSRGSWIVALVPDAIHDVRARSADGTTAVLTAEQNIAISRASSPFTEIAWTAQDGTNHRAEIGPN
jgi:hypothetical protein